MVNKYLVWSDEELKAMVIDDPEIRHYEWYRPMDLVYAHSRGQARALFTVHHDLEFIDPIHIQILDRDVQESARVASDVETYTYFLEREEK